MKINRVVVVHKRTDYEWLLLKHGSHGQAAFYLKSKGGNIEEVEAAHHTLVGSLDEVLRSLPKNVQRALIEQQMVGNFLFRSTDLIIVCGPDGLYVNVAKHLHDQPVLTVNADPTRIDGAVMRYMPSDVRDILIEIISGAVPLLRANLAVAEFGSGQTLLAVNDFFVGRKDHVSARYEISINGSSERQSSSGIIISTGMGSTGWLKSVMAMVSGISGSEDVPAIPLSGWEDTSLAFVVREPFKTQQTGTSIVFDTVSEGNELVIVSEIMESGIVFSDGMMGKGISFHAGETVRIRSAERHTNIVE